MQYLEFLLKYFEEPTMVTFYVSCALLGGLTLLVQLVLSLFGGDAEADLEDFVVDDVEADGSFGILSVRAVAAFLTFFGLTGWGGTNAGWSTPTIILVSLAVGLAVMLLVAWLLSIQRRLQSSGNLDPRNAVGQTATVYLRIPGGNGGLGKITLAVQGRTAEFAATTRGEDLPTGSAVRVVRMTTPGTFEVEPLS